MMWSDPAIKCDNYQVSVGIQCEQVVNLMDESVGAAVSSLKLKDLNPQSNDLQMNSQLNQEEKQIDEKELSRDCNGMSRSLEEHDSLDGDALIRSDISSERDKSSLSDSEIVKGQLLKTIDQESQCNSNLVIRSSLQIMISTNHSRAHDENGVQCIEGEKNIISMNNDTPPIAAKDNLLYSLVNQSEPFYLLNNTTESSTDKPQETVDQKEDEESEEPEEEKEEVFEEGKELSEVIKTLESSHMSDDVRIYSPPPSFLAEAEPNNSDGLGQCSNLKSEMASEEREEKNSALLNGIDPSEIIHNEGNPLAFPIEICVDEQECDLQNGDEEDTEIADVAEDESLILANNHHEGIDEDTEQIQSVDHSTDDVVINREDPPDSFNIGLPEIDHEELIRTFESMVEEDCDEFISDYDQALRQFEEDERKLGIGGDSSPSLTDSRESPLTLDNSKDKLDENLEFQQQVTPNSQKLSDTTTAIPKVVSRISSKSNHTTKNKEEPKKTPNIKSEKQIPSAQKKKNFSSKLSAPKVKPTPPKLHIPKSTVPSKKTSLGEISKLPANDKKSDPETPPIKTDSGGHGSPDVSREPSEASFSINEKDHGPVQTSQSAMKSKALLLKQRNLSETGRTGSAQIHFPIKENVATKKRREQFEAKQKEIQDKKHDEEYVTPLQRKEAEVKELRLKLSEAFGKVNHLEEEIDQFLIEKSRDTNGLLSQCAARIAALELEISQVEEANQESELMIKKLTLENSQHEEQLMELKREAEQLKKKSQELYLTIHKKGKSCAAFEREIEIEKLARETPQKVTESELKLRLEVTKQEIEKWRGIKLAERYANTEKPKTEEEARLKFMRDSMFHFLTEQKKELINEHLQALIKMAAFTDVQSKNINKALEEKRKHGKL